jgi:hypothetical protein
MPFKQKEVAIVVPIYKEQTTPDEDISFRQLEHFLGPYPKYLLAPKSLRVNRPGFGVKRFKDEFFKDVATYSALLLSKKFYESFSNYRYILIYQTDALVFSDQLLDWCAKGYDYVGAPWVRSPFTLFTEAPRVGNGGFSLRRVAGFLKVLNSKSYYQDPNEYWTRFCAGRPKHRQLLNLPRKYLKRLAVFNSGRWEAARWTREGFTHLGPNEDTFWSMRATKYCADFKIAAVEDAIKFSFEVAPRQCYEMNNRSLPFGCHGWARYDREFWEPFLLKKPFA